MFIYTRITHVKTHKHSASQGSGKVRCSDEVQSKNTSCFPGKAASEGACLLSYHLTSASRRELLTVVVFPVAEHADL